MSGPVAPAAAPLTARARIGADRSTVFRLVAEVELWPTLFPRVYSGCGRRSSVVWRIGPSPDGDGAACEVAVSWSDPSVRDSVLGETMLARVQEVAEGGSLAGRA